MKVIVYHKYQVFLSALFHLSSYASIKCESQLRAKPAELPKLEHISQVTGILMSPLSPVKLSRSNGKVNCVQNQLNRRSWSPYNKYLVFPWAHFSSYIPIKWRIQLGEKPVEPTKLEPTDECKREAAATSTE